MLGVINRINLAERTREVHKVVYMNKDYYVVRIPGSTTLQIKDAKSVFETPEQFEVFRNSDEFRVTNTYLVWSKSKKAFEYSELRDVYLNSHKLMELERRISNIETNTLDIDRKINAFVNMRKDMLTQKRAYQKELHELKAALYQKELTSLDN